MKKEYVLQGLGCANCAAKIEHDVDQMEGVVSASVNFVTTTLQVEIDNEFPGDIQREIEDIVRRHEPEVLVIDKTAGDKGPGSDQDTKPKWKIVRLIGGAVLLAAGVLLKRTGVNTYIPLAVFLLAYLLLGGDIIFRALKNISRGKIFDENFLMTAATAGAFAIGETAEAVAVMLFYQVGEYFQELAVRRSRKSIAGLMDIRPDYANLKRGERIVKVAPDTVEVGDIIVVKPGEKIPLDGIVLEGEALLDTAALTGESLPRRTSVSDTVLSGCLNQNGLLTIEVTQTFGESTVSKIIDLVENAAAKKVPTENFITKFARWYTPSVVGLAALIAIVPSLIGVGPWLEWLRRGLIFLVISCPCALVISIPLSFFGGIGGASRKGILIKGSNYLEALNHLDIVVFDKTGTLTKGIFEVTAVQPADGFSAAELLEATACAEAFSNHPIALSILKKYGGEVDKSNLRDYSETAGLGVSVNANGRVIHAGNEKLMERINIVVPETQRRGTRVFVAIDGLFAGQILISDEVKPDSGRAIAALKAKGVRETVMLTGDDTQIAAAVADELKLDGVYGGLLPQEKVERVEQLMTQKRAKGKLAFAGDGINDAPVLAIADVGVAMGGLGSDAAIEAADIVLMTDEPSKLAEAVDVARFTKRIVWQNIFFALGIKVVFLLLGALGLASMWEAVFADVGVAVLAILNAMRVMKK
ncbi:MAG: cadmium-translocating P-type ATPase [Clostridiales bacterium]|nr:cadmium-translocating P-type ATPase [Clostridiales bacterium]